MMRSRAELDEESAVSSSSEEEEDEDEDDETSSDDDDERLKELPPDVARWQPTEKEEKAKVIDFLNGYNGMGAADTIKMLVSSLAKEKDRARASRALSHIAGAEIKSRAIQEACRVVNIKNRTIYNLNKKLFQPVMQEHGGSSSSSLAVIGTFPTTYVLEKSRPDYDKTLADPVNSTNLVVNTLLGQGEDGSMVRDNAVVANLIPTTVKGGYEKVPGESVFRLFQDDFMAFFRNLLRANVCVIFAISDRVAKLLLGEFRGEVVTLTSYGLHELRLVFPRNGEPNFLLAVPLEHVSHLRKRGLRYASRLKLAAGCAATSAPLRALLQLPALPAARLLALLDVGSQGGSRGGAFFEASMKHRVWAFIAVYGEQEGRRLWEKWYYGKKRAGGRNGGSVPSTDGECVVDDKTPFLVEMDRAKYGCTVTNEDGTPRGCRVMVIGKTNRNKHYDANALYGYVRVASGLPRQHGPHEDECERAAEENEGWGTKEITKYKRR